MRKLGNNERRRFDDDGDERPGVTGGVEILRRRPFGMFMLCYEGDRTSGRVCVRVGSTVVCAGCRVRKKDRGKAGEGNWCVLGRGQRSNGGRKRVGGLDFLLGGFHDIVSSSVGSSSTRLAVSLACVVDSGNPAIGILDTPNQT